VGKRFGLVTLVLVLAVASLSFTDETQTVTAVAPSAGPAIRPLDVVTSSVSRGLASLRSRRIGFNAGEDRHAEIRGTAHDFFDVTDMARRALGPHWKGLLPREHEEFVRLFEDVLSQSFVTIVERYTDNVASLDEEVAGAFAQVRSRITPEEGSEIAIEYRLSRHGSQWTVYDIVLDGVSLVSNYRSQFNSIIGTSSVAQLLERMRTARSRRPPSRDAVDGAASAEHEESARGRLAAGLLLSVASNPRWR
jgi:phospholipid transport system substrate-binding protein